MKQITPVSGNAPRVGETTEAEGQGNNTSGRCFFIAWSKTLVAAKYDFVVFSAMGRVISEQVGAAVRPSGVRGAKSTHWRYYSFDHPGGHEDAAMPKPPLPPGSPSSCGGHA